MCLLQRCWAGEARGVQGCVHPRRVAVSQEKGGQLCPRRMVASCVPLPWPYPEGASGAGEACWRHLPGLCVSISQLLHPLRGTPRQFGFASVKSRALGFLPFSCLIFPFFSRALFCPIPPSPLFSAAFPSARMAPSLRSAAGTRAPLASRCSGQVGGLGLVC